MEEEQHISQEKAAKIKELIELIKDTPQRNVLAKHNKDYHHATIVDVDAEYPCNVLIEWDWKTNRKQKYDIVQCYEIIYSLITRSSRRSVQSNQTNLDEALKELPELRKQKRVKSASDYLGKGARLIPDCASTFAPTLLNPAWMKAPLANSPQIGFVIDEGTRERVRELIQLLIDTKVQAKHQNQYYEATIRGCNDEDGWKVNLEWSWKTNRKQKLDAVPCNHIIYPLFHRSRTSRRSMKDTNLEEALRQLPELRKRKLSQATDPSDVQAPKHGTISPSTAEKRTGTRSVIAVPPSLKRPATFSLSSLPMTTKLGLASWRASKRNQVSVGGSSPVKPKPPKMMGSLPAGCDKIAIFNESFLKVPPQEQQTAAAASLPLTAKMRQQEQGDIDIEDSCLQRLDYDEDEDDRKPAAKPTTNVVPARERDDRHWTMYEDGRTPAAKPMTNTVTPVREQDDQHWTIYEDGRTPAAKPMTNTVTPVREQDDQHWTIYEDGRTPATKPMTNTVTPVREQDDQHWTIYEDGRTPAAKPMTNTVTHVRERDDQHWPMHEDDRTPAAKPMTNVSPARERDDQQGTVRDDGRNPAAKPTTKTASERVRPGGTDEVNVAVASADSHEDICGSVKAKVCVSEMEKRSRQFEKWKTLPPPLGLSESGKFAGEISNRGTVRPVGTSTNHHEGESHLMAMNEKHRQQQEALLVSREETAIFRRENERLQRLLLVSQEETAIFRRENERLKKGKERLKRQNDLLRMAQ